MLLIFSFAQILHKTYLPFTADDCQYLFQNVPTNSLPEFSRSFHTCHVYTLNFYLICNIKLCLLLHSFTQFEVWKNNSIAFEVITFRSVNKTRINITNLFLGTEIHFGPNVGIRTKHNKSYSRFWESVCKQFVFR